MSIPVNLGDQLQYFELIPATTITSDGNGSGVDLQAYAGEIALILSCAKGTGNADNTFDIKIQESDDNSSFTDVSGAAFSQVLGSSGADSLQKISLNKNELKRYIRAVKDVGGTSPSYRVALVGVALNKYSA